MTSHNSTCKFGNLCNNKKCSKKHSIYRKRLCGLGKKCTNPNCNELHKSNVCFKTHSHNIKKCRMRHVKYKNECDKMRCSHNEGYGRCTYTCLPNDIKCMYHSYRGPMNGDKCKCGLATHHWVKETLSDGDDGYSMCRKCYLRKFGFSKWDLFYQPFISLMKSVRNSCFLARKQFIEEEEKKESLQYWEERSQYEENLQIDNEKEIEDRRNHDDDENDDPNVAILSNGEFSGILDKSSIDDKGDNNITILQWLIKERD